VVCITLLDVCLLISEELSYYSFLILLKTASGFWKTLWVWTALLKEQFIWS